MRLRSISVRSEACQATADHDVENYGSARMTSKKAASSLRKIRFLTSRSHSVSFELILVSLYDHFRGLEAVAGAAHGFEVARVFRVGLDFFADAANVNVDRARGHVRSVAPDGIEKMIAGKNAAEVAGKIIEQAELGGGGGERFVREQ